MSQITPPGGGPGDTPYDRSEIDALGQGMPNLPTPQAGAAQFAQNPADTQQPQGLIPQLGAGQSTDQLTGDQLAQLDTNPDDVMVQEMEQALQDPQTPPQVKSAIEQQLLLAAKRQMLQQTQLGGQ